MKSQLQIFTNVETLAEELAIEFNRYINNLLQTQTKVCIAISGGSTPLIFFNKLAELNKKSHIKIEWRRIHFFWGDERCVPPTSAESNYGQAKTTLLDHIEIPEQNVHRILGESDPVEEVKRYGDDIRKNLLSKGGIPIFDWILLGVGDDGHTASIFPDQIALMNSNNICDVAIHPISKQKRITLSGKIINGAKRITFLAVGENKSDVVQKILNKEPGASKYPASKVQSASGIQEWYLDTLAAGDL